jgi:putative spermidine/putrescine transport system permease protein
MVAEGKKLRFYEVIFGVLVSVYLIAPIFVIIPMSFGPARFFSFPPPEFSIEQYVKFFQSGPWWQAIRISFEVAVCAAFFATILGILTALAMRYKIPAKGFLNALFISPMIVPLIITAVALYSFFSSLHLVDTVPGLIIAHTILTLPFVIITVTATLKGLDPTLEKAASTLGAGPLDVFFRITLPLIKPGAITGAVFAFMISFDETVVAIFLSSSQAITLPKKMWDSIRFSIEPILPALSTILILFAIVMLILLEVISKKKK